MCDVIIEKLTEEMVEDVFQIEKTFFDVTENKSILASLKSNTLEYIVLKYENNVIGFLEFSIVLDEAEIYEIAIKEKYQGQGFSKLLMDYFFNICDEKKICTIFLEVNSVNSKAINLYTKYGFKEYAIRKKYYGENDAILMKMHR